MSTDVISGFPRGALEHTVSVITGSRLPLGRRRGRGRVVTSQMGVGCNLPEEVPAPSDRGMRKLVWERGSG